MAKILFNPWLKQVKGRYGDLVFKTYLGRPVISQPPTRPDRPPTPSEVERRELFKLAVAYAKGAFRNPALAALYRRVADEKRQGLFSVALGDFLRAPSVGRVDLAGYHGRVGDPIKVLATDDVEVAGVTARITTAAGALVEQGVLVDIDGVWTYTATTVVAVGASLVIDITATDRADNTGLKSTPWVVTAP